MKQSLGSQDIPLWYSSSYRYLYSFTKRNGVWCFFFMSVWRCDFTSHTEGLGPGFTSHWVKTACTDFYSQNCAWVSSCPESGFLLSLMTTSPGASPRRTPVLRPPGPGSPCTSVPHLCTHLCTRAVAPPLGGPFTISHSKRLRGNYSASLLTAFLLQLSYFCQ